MHRLNDRSICNCKAPPIFDRTPFTGLCVPVKSLNLELLIQLLIVIIILVWLSGHSLRDTADCSPAVLFEIPFMLKNLKSLYISGRVSNSGLILMVITFLLIFISSSFLNDQFNVGFKTLPFRSWDVFRSTFDTLLRLLVFRAVSQFPLILISNQKFGDVYPDFCFGECVSFLSHMVNGMGPKTDLYVFLSVYFFVQ